MRQLFSRCRLTHTVRTNENNQTERADTLMEQAERFTHEQDLIAYLEAVFGLSFSEINEYIRSGLFNGYLLNHIPAERFSAEAWSKALSACYGKQLSFETVTEARIWFCNQQIDQYSRPAAI